MISAVFEPVVVSGATPIPNILKLVDSTGTVTSIGIQGVGVVTSPYRESSKGRSH